jgi:hypothetical protein
LDLLLTESVKNHEKTTSSHVAFSQFTLLLFFSAARSRCAAGMPHVCSFLERSTMPAALTLTRGLFGVFGSRMFCEACLSIASACGPQGAMGTARTGNNLFAFPLLEMFYSF